MAQIRASKDIWAPGVTKDHRVLVARAGQLVDERLAARYAGTDAVADEPADDNEADAAAPSYEDLKVPELRKLLEDRGVDHSDLPKKQDLVDALEYDDESRGA